MSHVDIAASIRGANPVILDQVASAIEEGEGYVILTLEATGLRLTPVVVPGDTNATVSDRKTLRGLVSAFLAGGVVSRLVASTREPSDT